MDGLRITRTVVIPDREISFRFARSGGPGGQNVNKRETQVELVFDLAGSPSIGPRQRERAMRRLATRLDSSGRLRIVSTEGRTQGTNRDLALERFRKLMADALRPVDPKRRPTRPGKQAVERRLESKRRRARRKRERTWREDD